MHTTDLLRHWTHRFHDHNIMVAHYADHLFHEKSFWGILIVAVLIAGLLLLITLLGDNINMKSFTAPYGPYY